MAGRLILLTTTHRIAPGLLTAPAWDLLRSSGRVLAGEADHPQLPHLAAAGVAAEVLPPLAPSQRAAALVEAARDAEVVWLGSTDGDPGLGEALATVLEDSAEPLPEVEVVTGSYDVPGARLLDLVAVTDRLRSPGGCPWDAKQTHESLVPYLLEEAYETVEVIEAADRDALREELGDLLLQVVFHARLAEEDDEEPWSIDDVAGGIVDKLVNRHPHVFAVADFADGAGDVVTPEHVEARWEQLKVAEKQRSSVVEGVPLAQPALSLADKLISRAQRSGLHVDIPRLDVAAAGERELGDLLLSIVAAAQQQNMDAEAALRSAARRYRERILAAEVTPAADPAGPEHLSDDA